MLDAILLSYLTYKVLKLLNVILQYSKTSIKRIPNEVDTLF